MVGKTGVATHVQPDSVNSTINGPAINASARGAVACIPDPARMHPRLHEIIGTKSLIKTYEKLLIRINAGKRRE